MTLSISGYRCFPNDAPCEFMIGPGFTGFVGPNNAGKSTLVRFLLEFRPVFRSLSHHNRLSAAVCGSGEPINLEEANVPDLQEVFHDAPDSLRLVEVDLHIVPRARPLTGVFVTRVRVNLDSAQNLTVTAFHEGKPLNDVRAQKEHPLLLQHSPVTLSLLELKHAFSVLANSLYVGAFRNLQNRGATAHYFDVPIGEAFVKQWHSDKGGRTKSRQREIQLVTSELERMFGFERLDIGVNSDATAIQLTVDRQPRRLEEMGAGFAHALFLLHSVVRAKPAFLLLDEPELGLHSAMQVKLLTTLGAYTEVGVIFSTHSLGLARTVADSLYMLSRDNDAAQPVLRVVGETRSLALLAGEMAFSAYEAFGGARVLLVEGRTEVLAVRELLRKLGAADHICVLPLGGSDLINGSSKRELREVCRFASEIAVIIDSEKAKQDDEVEPGRRSFVKDCEDLGMSVLVLERRAFENYLPQHAITRGVGKQYKELDPFERLGEFQEGWSKKFNWKIAREMSREDLDGTDLGSFLVSLVG